MIATLRLNNRFKIKPNSKGNFKVNDVQMNIDKVPFIRLRFNDWQASDVDYIKELSSIFTKSAIMVEMQLSENLGKQVECLSEILDKVAKYIYINVDDTDVERKDISDEVKDLIENQANTVAWDRIMLVDRSTTLDFVNANKLRTSVLEIFTDTSDELDDDETIDLIGVCSSPLSFGECACLTAVKARELMAAYCTTGDVPLPTANHQKGNCGCIQSLIVSSDIIELEPTKVVKHKIGSTSGTKEKAAKKEAEPKKKKVDSLSMTMALYNKIKY